MLKELFWKKLKFLNERIYYIKSNKKFKKYFY